MLSELVTFFCIIYLINRDLIILSSTMSMAAPPAAPTRTTMLPVPATAPTAPTMVM